MILKFLKQLFCFPHHYEQELSPFDEEWWEECRKCEKTRKVKWIAYISFENKHHYLGIYTSFEEACLVREEAEIKYYGVTK